MTPAEYRAKAEELSALARLAANPAMRVECEKLAKSFLLLADQAERNSRTDLVYETPRPAESPPQVAQQQQQIQPKKT